MSKAHLPASPDVLARLLVSGAAADLSADSVRAIAHRLLRVEADLADVVTRAHEQALIVKPFHDKAPRWRRLNEPGTMCTKEGELRAREQHGAPCWCGKPLPHDVPCQYTTDPEAT